MCNSYVKDRMQLKYLNDLDHMPCMRKSGHETKVSCQHCRTTIVFNIDQYNIDVYEYIKNVSFYIFIFNFII